MIVRILLLLLLGYVIPASAAPWNLPVELSDSNAKIRFEVDSTWHLVKGATSGLTGKVWLESPANFQSVRGELSLPVARFDTDNRSRDSKMRGVMDEPHHANVIYVIDSVEGLPSPSLLADGGEANLIIHGVLSIMGNAKPVQSAAILRRTGETYLVEGSFSLQWADFGVEDPSILVAKLDPTVNVFFSIQLARKE